MSEIPIRRWFPFTVLGLVIVLAGLLSTGWSIWWLAPIHWLGRYPLFHIVAHLGIFAGVVLLYQPRQHGGIKLGLLVLAGGILIEMAQFITGGFVLTTRTLADSLFDLVIDISGAVVCWLVLVQHRHTKNLADT
jgi:hypothetical protein